MRRTCSGSVCNHVLVSSSISKTRFRILSTACRRNSGIMCGRLGSAVWPTSMRGQVLLGTSRDDGPPVMTGMMGTLGPRFSSSVSRSSSVLKVVTSPMCLGGKCSSRSLMHSLSVSQLRVSDGSAPRDLEACHCQVFEYWGGEFLYAMRRA